MIIHNFHISFKGMGIFYNQCNEFNFVIWWCTIYFCLFIRLDDPESDGDYFETAPDGTVRLKKGKQKIDINKLKDEDLVKLGLDPTKMTKQEIARALKVKNQF